MMNTHSLAPHARRQTALHILFALLILTAAFGLRVWNLNGESVWHDEGWSIRAIRAPFESPDDRTPFAYYAAMHGLWRAGMGESSFAYRYGSLLLGVLGVALAMRLGWRWYGAAVGLAAGVMLALSPLLWDYSQEVRAYIAVPLLATAMLYLAGRLLTSPPFSINSEGETSASSKPTVWKYWALLFAVELVALYTHNLAVPLVAWLNLALMAVWLFRRDGRRLALWVGLQAVLLLLYLPWLLNQSPSGTPLNTPPQWGIGLLRDIWYSYFLPAPLQLRQSENVLLDLLGLALLIGVSAIIIRSLGLLILTRHSAQFPAATQHSELSTFFSPSSILRPPSFLLLSHVVLVPIFTTILITAAHIDFHPRYFIAGVPATIILAAAVSGQLPAFSRLKANRPQHFFLVALTVAVSLISLGSIGALLENRAYQHDDFAGLAAYYARLPADTVILLPFGTEPALQVYYAGQMDIAARFVNLPLYSDEAAALAAINQLVEEGTARVEFLTWYQLPADPRGMYPCLLTAASSSVDEPRAFFGLMTQGYSISQPVTMQTVAADTRFAGGLSMKSAAYAASSAGVCLRTAWASSIDPTATVHPDDQAALEHRPALSVAAALLNPLESEIARTDAEVARANPFAAMEWPSLTYGEAYNLLHLPEGAPRRDYGLALTLYSPEQPSGYDLLDERGNAAGKVYSLPDVVHAAGAPYAGEPAASAILQRDNAGDDRAVDSGTPLDITLLLPAGEGVDTLRLAGDDWSIEQPVTYADAPTLSWHRFVVPPGDGGEAALLLDGAEIARYTVVDVPRAFDPPPYEFPVGVDFPGIGGLVGANVSRVAADGHVEVTLIWQAESTPDTAYTVFVQLIGADGSVLAQSDHMPAGDTRPTTGWLAGEYVTDIHRLTVPAFEGSASLITGLYDAASPGFPRVLTADGTDFVRLPIGLDG